MRYSGFILLCAATILAQDDKPAELKRAEVRAKLAAKRHEFAAEALKEALAGHKASTVSDAELLVIKLVALDAVVESLRRSIDLEEVKATGRAPNDDIDAPRVGQRDFVHERLDVSLEQAIRKEKAAVVAMKKAKALHVQGMMPRDRLDEFAVEHKFARLARTAASKLKEIRAGFTGGKLSRGVQRSAALVRATAASARVGVRVDVARVRATQLRIALQAGRATPAQVREADAELAHAETALGLAELVVKQLKKNPNAR